MIIHTRCAKPLACPRARRVGAVDRAGLALALALACAACGGDAGAMPAPAGSPTAAEPVTPPAAVAAGAGSSAGPVGPTAGTSTPMRAAAAAGGTAGPSAGAPAAGSPQPSASGESAPPPVAGSGGATSPGAAPTDPAMPATMPVDTGEPMPSVGCMGGSIEPGRTMGSIDSSGGNRTYIQYVPDSYDGQKPVPLLIDLHPYSVGASYAESSSGFRQLADTEGYVYIAPQGIGNEWDSTGDTDEKFIRDLVFSLTTDACIDMRRVYATGCSNGGAMSFLLMCTAEDVFAAVAPMCGTSFVDLETNCMMDRPVSMMLRIGSGDTLNCWEGEGMVLDAPNVPMGTRVPCAKTVQKVLGEKFHCKGQIKMEDNCEFLGDCDQGSEIAICSENTGHVVYSTKAARDTWDFLSRFYKH